MRTFGLVLALDRPRGAMGWSLLCSLRVISHGHTGEEALANIAVRKAREPLARILSKENPHLRVLPVGKRGQRASE